MAFSWTTEQQQVIDARGTNLLVSAAAGSGKTAVLVERILSRVTDPEHPVDIDRMLIVTFTRAAAAEMKERIARTLEKRLHEDPENTHLQRQSILIDHAQISTIDGFCTFVLQNYFPLIDLDPGYRIADESELKVLKKKVIADLLEEEYADAENNPGFTAFMRAYGNRRSDDDIAGHIERIYTFATSNPDPEEWLTRCLAAYEPDTPEELEAAPWMRLMQEEALFHMRSLAEDSRRLVAFVSREPEAPQAYLSALRQDAAMLGSFPVPENYEQWRLALHGLDFVKLSGKRMEGENEEIREAVKKRREKIKKEVEVLRKTTFGMPFEEVLAELGALRPYAEELIRLVRRFREAFRAAKQAQNLLDFQDLELYALKILAEKDDDGHWRPTEAGKELAGRFEEVMIDEYQDSNALQEALLSAVSGKGEVQNRFMVGDIKQSIYGFRQARPDIFLEKYKTYATGASGNRIDLHRNFRSRPQVLEAVNAVFQKLMIPELGGITYDEDAALRAGADYPPHPDETFPQTELYIIDKNAERFSDAFGRESRMEAEAQLVANHILELTKNGQLWDADVQAYRPAEYRDCVVLLRSASGWSDIFVRVLKQAGIPAYAVAGSGFFASTEVTTALHLLRICDNPRQDIPLAAVLRSPIGDFSDVDLARLRAGLPDRDLYETLLAGAEGATGDERLTGMCAAFLAQLNDFRDRVGRVPVSRLLASVLRETGYEDYVSAMPAGAQGRANLNMLIEQAATFEKTRSHDLFSFVRHIEELNDQGVDFGEVNLHGEEENTVRVMTIHKSKGLEFPIVFLAGIGKGGNSEDSKKIFVMHEKFGVGMAAVYPGQRRIHRNTLLRTAIRDEIRRDAAAEELRVLYVAMTRAKEKLILIGSGDPNESATGQEGTPTYMQILRAGSYLDWIRMTADPEWPIHCHTVREEDLAISSMIHDTVSASRVPEIRSLLMSGRPGTFHAETGEALRSHAIVTERKAERLHFPAKMTVSELKYHAEAFSEDERGEELYPQKTRNEVLLPDSPLTGAARGTAYHHALAAFSGNLFSAGETDPEQIGAELDRQLDRGILSPEERSAVSVGDLAAFLQSPLGIRMAEAAKQGTLRREQPFVLDLPAEEIDILRGDTPPVERQDKEDRDAAKSEESETILIQGTIDAYWEEEGSYILIDYKTDRIAPGGEDELIRRYRIQLDCYARALEQITGIPVREKWIYSIALKKAILL